MDFTLIDKNTSTKVLYTYYTGYGKIKFYFKKHYFLVSDLQVLTRNALRDVSQDPALCALLRRAKPDDRLERLAKLIEKLKVSSGF